MEQLTAKDLYKEFWECRNFEIDHLWQRSVFLAVFLIAIAAGYGAFVNDHIKYVFPASQNANADIPALVFHIICIGLCLLGILFLQLWIMMAKGSKYWYERYEDAISVFYRGFTNNKDIDKYKLFAEDARKWMRSGKLPFFGNLGERKNEGSLLSTKGGAFSVSRINIFIGQLICFVWIVLASIHLYFAISENASVGSNVAVVTISIFIFVFIAKEIISCFTHSED